MVEELNIPEVLTRLDGLDLSPIERVLAAHTGTVQLLLSLYFGEPVDVVVLKQEETEDEVRREVGLVLRHRGQEVCHAVSTISLRDTSPAAIDDVRAGALGIGQIALKHGVSTQRRLQDLKVDADSIWRRYEMWGPGIFYTIEETFHRALYRL